MPEFPDDLELQREGDANLPRSSSKPPSDRLLIVNWFIARPLVLDAARVKGNCFSLPFIPAPFFQSWWRATIGKFY